MHPTTVRDNTQRQTTPSANSKLHQSGMIKKIKLKLVHHFFESAFYLKWLKEYCDILQGETYTTKSIILSVNLKMINFTLNKSI